MRPVESDTFLLVPHTVADLDDFVQKHDEYLVSIYAEPGRAAVLWRDRLKRNPYGSEGFVSLSYYGHDLIDADLWDDTAGIWSALVGVVEGFVASGDGSATFPGQPVPLGLRTQGAVQLFSVGQRRTPVDAALFVPGVLTEAERFFTWTEREVGADESDVLTRLRALRDRTS